MIFISFSFLDTYADTFYHCFFLSHISDAISLMKDFVTLFQQGFRNLMAQQITQTIQFSVFNSPIMYSAFRQLDLEQSSHAAFTLSWCRRQAAQRPPQPAVRLSGGIPFFFSGDFAQVLSAVRSSLKVGTVAVCRSCCTYYALTRRWYPWDYTMG